MTSRDESLFRHFKCWVMCYVLLEPILEYICHIKYLYIFIDIEILSFIKYKQLVSFLEFVENSSKFRGMSKLLLLVAHLIVDEWIAPMNCIFVCNILNDIAVIGREEKVAREACRTTVWVLKRIFCFPKNCYLLIVHNITILIVIHNK